MAISTPFYGNVSFPRGYPNFGVDPVPGTQAYYPQDFYDDYGHDDDESDEDRYDHDNRYHPRYKRRTPFQVANALPSWTPYTGYNDGSRDVAAFRRWLQSKPSWRNRHRRRPSHWKAPWRGFCRRRRASQPVIPPVMPAPVIPTPIVPESQPDQRLQQSVPIWTNPFASFAPLYASPYICPAPYLTPAPQPAPILLTPTARTPAAPPVLATPYVLPYQWVAHPYPHPQIPSNHFWTHAPAAVRYVPVTPAYTPGHLQRVTGGHPLPGCGPGWTGEAWRPDPFNTGVQISPWLAPNPRNAAVPHILWDVAIDHPSSIKRLTERGLLVDFAGSPQWDTPVIFPEVKSIKMSLPGADELWGPISVTRDRNVTVGDLYYALYEFLQKPMTENDFSRIRASTGGEERLKRIEDACWRRCADSHGLPEAIRNEGYKRVDILEGSTVFWGMWCRSDGNGNFYLCVGFCPPWM